MRKKNIGIIFLVLFLCLNFIFIELPLINNSTEGNIFSLKSNKGSLKAFSINNQAKKTITDVLNQSNSSVKERSQIVTKIQENLTPPNESITFSSQNHPNITRMNIELDDDINSIGVGDFNNDSIPDITACENNGQVYFFDGLTGVTLYVNYDAYDMDSVVVADFNNDSIPDVAAGNMAWLYFINGANGETLGFLQIGARLLDTADFNNDSIPDVVAGHSEVNFINGVNREVFYSSDDSTGILWLETLVTSDFNNDSIPDVATGGKYSGVNFINGATGELFYNNTEPGTFVRGLGVGDFNNDSIPDVAASATNGVFFINGSTGETLYNLSLGGYGLALIVEDFNNDSTPDVASAIFEKGIYCLDGKTGAILYNYTELIPTYVKINFLAYDYNSDFIQDVIVGSYHGGIYIINGFTSETIYSDKSLVKIRTLALADINDDIFPDVIIGADIDVHVLFYDSFEPVIQSCILPLVPTSEVTLDFQLIFDEPYIERVYMNYSVNNEIEVIQPSSMTSNTATFTIPSVHSNQIKFWFWANDSWGNSKNQGDKNNPYSLQLTNRFLFENTEAKSLIWALAAGDFNNDSTPDVVAGATNGVHFINGATGETLYNNSEVKSATNLKVADFNNDAIPDVVAGTLLNQVYFINGATGETLYTNTTIPDGGPILAVADFNNDSIPDVAVGTFFNIHLINGATGETLFIISPPRRISTLLVTDFNNDSIPDVAVASRIPDAIIHFIDGQTGTYFYNTSLPFSEIKILETADFNNDSIPDIVAGSSAIYFVNGATGEMLYNSTELGGIVTLIINDYNNDKIPDVGVGTTNGIYLIDGTSGNVISSIKTNLSSSYVLEDITKDSIPDAILVTGDKNLLIIDGITGKTKESFSIPDVVWSNTLLEDFDQNGLADIVIGSRTGIISAFQPLSSLYELRPSSEIQSVLYQGNVLNITISLQDVYGRQVEEASVSLMAHKNGTKTFSVYSSTPDVDGTYNVSISTGDWRTGEWYLFFLASRSPYTSLELSSYTDINGNYLPSSILALRGKISPEYILSSGLASFSPESGVLSPVLEGSNVTLQINLQDEFYHTLTQSDIEVTLLISNQSFMIPLIEPGKGQIIITTKGANYGIYNLTVIITGQYLDTIQRTLMIDIIPRFPTIDITAIPILFIICLVLPIVSYGLSIRFMPQLKKAYQKFPTDPRDIWIRDDSSPVPILREGITTVQKILNGIIDFTIFIFLGTWVLGIIFLVIYPIVGFLLILLAFGEILFFTLFYFFFILYKQVLKINFSIKRFILGLGAPLAFVAILLASIFIFASQIQWLDFYMKINFIFPFIPTIIFDVFVSFISGIILTIIIAIVGAYRDIKKLEQVKEKIGDYYYPKEPYKLQDAIAEESKSSFKSLIWGFLIWYVLLLYTFINTFQITPYIPFLAIVILPVIIAFGVVFRDLIRDFIDYIIQIINDWLKEKDDNND